MEEFARYLEDLRRQILGGQSEEQLDPISQMILGFIEFLDFLFDPNDESADLSGRGYESEGENFDHDHGDAPVVTGGDGTTLFNGIRPRASDLETWRRFQREADVSRVEHISPIDDRSVVLTSDRGERGGRMHHGLDLDTTSAGVTPNAVASADGVVLLAGNFPQRGGRVNFGNTVIIGHADGTYTVYAHLAQIDPDIRPGAMIQQNQVLGPIGRSGGAEGVHLHYEQRRGANSIDPVIHGWNGAGTLPDLAAQGVAYQSSDADITLEAFIAMLRGQGEIGRIRQ